MAQQLEAESRFNSNNFNASNSKAFDNQTMCVFDDGTGYFVEKVSLSKENKNCFLKNINNKKNVYI